MNVGGVLMIKTYNWSDNRVCCL